jgi:hypothetical protein
MRSDGKMRPNIHPRQYLAVTFLIATMLAVYIVAVPPASDAPLNDDWAYAQSVRHLLDEGRLHVSDWAAPSLIPQIYLAHYFRAWPAVFHLSIYAGRRWLARPAAIRQRTHLCFALSVS